MYNDYTSCPDRVGRHLRMLGVDPKLLGYRCLCDAVVRSHEDPAKLLKEIYPETAKQCQLSDGRCVEHAIRTAVSKAWTQRNKDIWSYYFPTDMNGDIKLPTNKAFISAIAKLL